MRQDELDLVQTLSSAPILYGRCPTVTGVTQAMSKDDGRRVGVDGWENKGLCPALYDICHKRPGSKIHFSEKRLYQAVLVNVVLMVKFTQVNSDPNQ